MLSLSFNNIYINDFECITGKNEKNGNLRGIKNVIDKFYYNEKTFEQAQIKMQIDVIDNLLKKNNLIDQDINIVIGGDLNNQLSGINYALNNFDISLLGVYSACSSFIESLILASIMLENKSVNKVITATSSHNLSQEREFRYPVEYGCLRNENSTFTLTASLAALLTNKKSNISIKKATIGSVVELGVNDPNYIGAVMAPACAEAIINHLNNFNKNINDYDLILTGDLGNVGLNILKDYLYEEFNIECKNIIDAGSNIYKDLKDINDGASGPVCLPLYFFYNILNKSKYKNILLVGTGSLHSRCLVNQKLNIPAISHIVEIEVLR